MSQAEHTTTPIPRQEAFMKLYDPAHARLSRYCHAMLSDREEAKDLMSDTVLAAFEQFDNLKNPNAFDYYLFGIASRLMRKKIRRKKFLGVFNQEAAEQVSDHSQAPDTSAEVQLLYDTLKKLPAELREVVVLFEINGFPLKEIADLKQTNINTVKTRLSRGRVRLKQLMGIREEKKKEAVTIPLVNYQDSSHKVSEAAAASTKQGNYENE